MTPYEKGLRAVREKMILRGVLNGVLMLAGILLMAAAAVKTPSRVAGDTSVSDVREALAVILACDVLAGLCLLGAVYLIFDTIAMLIRSKTSTVKVYRMLQDPDNPYLKPDKRCAKMLFKNIIGYLLALGVTGFIVAMAFCRSHSFLSTGEGGVGVSHIRNTLFYTFLDEKLGKTETVYIGELEFESCPVPLYDKFGSEENYYWITADNGTKIPVTVLDKAVISKFWERNRKQRESLLRINYYKRSGLIESYEFVADRRDMESFDLPQVELELADDLTVSRPADMSQYGELAWAIERNGELLHGEGVDDDTPYTVAADTEKLDVFSVEGLKKDDMKGEFSVTLVKVFSYPDPAGYLDPEIEVLPVSNTVTFTIAGGSDLIKAFADKKLEIEVDEENFKVTLPKLPDGYSNFADLYLAQELSGRLVSTEFGSDPYTITYGYAEGLTISLNNKSAHHKIYVYALDDEGQAVAVSNIVEFDYMSEKDKLEEQERQKQLEFFEPVMQALEDHDKPALKALICKRIIKNDKDLDDKLDKVFMMYSGGKIVRDALYPYTYDYEDGRIKQTYGDLWLTLDDGRTFRITLTVVSESKESEDEAGMNYFIFSDGESFESVTIS